MDSKISFEQGLADVFAMLEIPFSSPQAAKLNLLIFETIYHGALEASHEIAVERGEPYMICDDVF